MLQYHTHLARLQPALTRTGTTFISEKQTRSEEGGLGRGQLEVFSHVKRRLVGRVVVVLMVLVMCWSLLMIFVVVCRSCQTLSPAPPAQPTGRGAISQLGAYRPCDRRVESGQLQQNNINYCYLQHHHHPPSRHKLNTSLYITHFIVKPETSIFIWQ